MSLLLAPYNEAMRLGMGFNSYTQQLCVNDVVRKPGGVKATEEDLQPANPPTSNAQRDAILAGDPEKILQSNKGEMIMQSRMLDGQKGVSQVVSWEAGFVDSLSEVTNKLNITGALSISVDALGGSGSVGVSASGTYTNNKAFANADAKYDITVKVTNQRLVAPEITQFCPIPNVPEGRFTDVYGDCFISGFIEGGVFHALVTKTRVNNSSLKGIKGSIELEAGFKGGFAAKGSLGGEMVDEKKDEQISTQITLNWSGGGDIKPDSVNEWTIPNLLKVAMEFPDNVASCPQRTYAVLTKYTNLRTFHEQTVKGSPLDYENAGIYTSSLLDAYMDYKSTWRDIQSMITDVNAGMGNLRDGSNDPRIAEYGESFKDDYEARKARFDEANQLALANPRAYAGVVLEEPLPSNDFQPYKADLFGLDKARRDCRFEMIKIVREVNEVTTNPRVATDPHRNWRYLSPNIFRRLLPRAQEEQEAGKSAAEKEAADRQAQEAKIKEAQAMLETELNQARAEIAKLKEDSANHQKTDETQETELNQARAEIAKLKEDATSHQQTDNALAQRLKETESQLARLQQQEADRKASLPPPQLAPGWSSVKLINTNDLKFSPASRITIVSRKPETWECWWIAPNGSVQGAYHYDGSTDWGRYELAPAGSAALGGICAAAYEPTAMTVRWTGPNGSIEGAYWSEGSTWRREQLRPDRSAIPGSPMVAISREPGYCEFWWLGPECSVENATWRRGPWSFNRIANPGAASTTTDLLAVAHGASASRIFWTSPSGSLECCTKMDIKPELPYESNRVLQQVSAPGSVAQASRLAGTSKGGIHAEVWFASPSGAVNAVYTYESSGSWGRYELSGDHSVGPGMDLRAVSPSPKRMDVLWVAPDGSIRAQGGVRSFHEWPVGTPGLVAPNTPLALISRQENVIDLIYVAASGGLVAAVFSA